MNNNTTLDSPISSLLCTKPPPPTSEQQIYLHTFAIINCFLSLLIVSGNTLVLMSFFTNTRLRTKCNLFLVSLASADMLVGLVDIPFWDYMLLHWFDTPQLLIFVFTLFDVLLGVSSVMSLLALSVARCYSVLKPFTFQAQRDEGYIIAAALFPWCTGGIACIVMYFLNETNQLASGSIMGLFYFLPLMIILPAYGIMFNKGFKMAKTNNQHNLSVREDLKAAKTAAIIIGCFIVTWLPFFMFQIIMAASSKRCPDFDTFTWALPMLKLLQHTHSALNPAIYGVRNTEFRRTFSKILKLNCFCLKQREFNSANTEWQTVSTMHL